MDLVTKVGGFTALVVAIQGVLPVLPGLAAPYGLVTATAWGVSDYVATGAARAFSHGLVAMLLVTSTASTLLLTLALPGGLVGGWSVLSSIPLTALVLLAVIAVLEAGGHLMLYVAFARGPLALVAPIATASPAVAALLALGDGYRANMILLLGVCLLFCSALLASVERSHHPSLALVQIPSAGRIWLLSESLHQSALSPEFRKSLVVQTISVETSESRFSRFRRSWRFLSTPGIGPALTAASVQGLGFFLLLFLPSNLTGAVSTWLIFAVGTLFLVLIGSCMVALMFWRRLRDAVERVSLHAKDVSSLSSSSSSSPRLGGWSQMGTYGRLAAVGVLDAVAFLSYSAGQHAGAPILTAGLASMATVITVLLAVLLLRENLSIQQWIGVVCAVFGLVLASIGGAL